MRKVFIDCGSHCGCSVRKFRKLHKDSDEYEIYSFECNKDLFKYFKDLGVTLITKAVWIENCVKKFYIGQDNQKRGSSLIQDKKTFIDEKIYREVLCIDFPQWIKDQFTKEDYVILKLNIEGAEYDILNKMVENGSIGVVKELFVDFHSNRMKNRQKYKVNGLNIKATRWNADNYCIKQEGEHESKILFS